MTDQHYISYLNGHQLPLCTSLEDAVRVLKRRLLSRHSPAKLEAYECSPLFGTGIRGRLAWKAQFRSGKTIVKFDIREFESQAAVVIKPGRRSRPSQLAERL
jgi:hypothetical protein